MGIHRPPEVIEHGSEPAVGLLPAGDDHPGDDVPVTVEVLRHAVHDDVGAERERPLQERGRERVVDHQQRARPAGDPRACLDVAQLDRRVGRGLEVDHPGLGADRLADDRRVLGGHPRGLDPEPREVTLEQPPGRTVDRVRADDMGAGTEERQEHRRDRRHARRRAERAVAALELADRVLERVDRRVAQARVLVAGRRPGEPRGALLRAREQERRRLVDRHRYRAVLGRRLHPAVNGDRLRFHRGPPGPRPGQNRYLARMRTSRPGFRAPKPLYG